MRINLAKKQNVLAEKFIKLSVADFASEFEFPNQSSARDYISTGKQGLEAFVQFLVSKGYGAKMYHLLPNKDLFTDVGDNWQQVARKSPSFGFYIDDTDPKLVEFKLKHG